MIRRRILPLIVLVPVAGLAALAGIFPKGLAGQVAPPAKSPWALVAWTPIPENPVFSGTGRDTWDRKIRERGYILVGEDGTYHLWYTGYASDRPSTMSLGHATSRDGIRWTRDPANPIFTGNWVEDMCVLMRDGTYSMFAEGR